MRSGADQLGMPDQEGENVRRLKSLLADYEAAATADFDIEQTRSATLQVFAEYYAEEFSWIEAPTPFYPQGRSGGRLEMTAAIERVSERLSVRRYTLVSVIASGDRVAAELVWEGTRRDDGGLIRFQMATFYRWRRGKIIEIHEYPCLEPETID